MPTEIALRLDTADAVKFLPAGRLAKLAPDVAAHAAALERREGPGADRLGWLDPEAACPAVERAALRAAAERARGDCDLFVVIGIGGSYLGARALLEALRDETSGPEVVFAGTSLCAAGLRRLLSRAASADLRLCVISKSGTTIEPAVAFRCLRTLLVERYGRQEASRRITAVTDARKGHLRRMATEEGWETFAVPDTVGGRFSVLTPVGLLPLAVAGLDLEAIVAGAAAMRAASRAAELARNPAHLYAAVRHALLEAGYRTEVLSSFHSDLRSFQEWWKQLFGESEGKEGKGIFPAAAALTTDLHSLGQYLQEGRRDLFETFLHVERAAPEVVVPAEPPAAPSATGAANAAGTPAAFPGAPGDGDGLGYLVGRPLDEINQRAYEGTRRAHVAGGLPCLSLTVERLTPRVLGELVYFFQKAVAVSGRLLGVNPFDQPGVEAYKREMFRLLGRPE